MKRMPDPTSYSAIGWVLIAIVSLVVAINQVDDFLKRRNGKESDRTVGPQPFQVTEAKEFVHKREFEKHVEHNTNRHGQLFSAIDQVKAEAAESLKEDVGELRKEITDVSKQVAGIDAAMELQNQQLQRIETNLINVLKTRRAA
jgi:hypothetical protein